MPQNKQDTLKRFSNPLDFFETPDDLADEVVRRAYIATLPPGARVLEPSAGRGALARAIGRVRTDLCLDLVELDGENGEHLRTQGFTVRHADFFDCEQESIYEAIVMNPPFKAIAGKTYIDHIYRAWDVLAPGCTLVAITPVGFLINQRHTKERTFRAWVEENGDYEEQARGQFKAVGTNVKTALVVLEKPTSRAWRRTPHAGWPSRDAHDVWQFVSHDSAALAVAQADSRQAAVMALTPYWATYLLDRFDEADWQALTAHAAGHQTKETPMTATPWQAGHQARLQNVPITANPYPDTPGRVGPGVHWLLGWRTADDEIRAAAADEQTRLRAQDDEEIDAALAQAGYQTSDGHPIQVAQVRLLLGTDPRLTDAQMHENALFVCEAVAAGFTWNQVWNLARYAIWDGLDAARERMERALAPASAAPAPVARPAPAPAPVHSPSYAQHLNLF